MTVIVPMRAALGFAATVFSSFVTIEVRAEDASPWQRDGHYAVRLLAGSRSGAMLLGGIALQLDPDRKTYCPGGRGQPRGQGSQPVCRRADAGLEPAGSRTAERQPAAGQALRLRTRGLTSRRKPGRRSPQIDAAWRRSLLRIQCEFKLVSCGAAWRARYAAVQPPSIERLAPVICAASSPHKYNASAATCSDVTNSLVGCAASSTSLMTCSLVRLRAFMVSGICFSTSGVQT